MEDIVNNIDLEDIDESLLDDEEDTFGDVDIEDEDEDDVLVESYDDEEEF